MILAQGARAERNIGSSDIKVQQSAGRAVTVHRSVPGFTARIIVSAAEGGREASWGLSSLANGAKWIMAEKSWSGVGCVCVRIANGPISARSFRRASSRSHFLRHVMIDDSHPAGLVGRKNLLLGLRRLILELKHSTLV